MTKRTEDDDDEILKDGQTLRVPMMLMDGIQRAVASDTINDTVEFTDTASHRPGSLPLNDSDRQKRAALCDRYDQLVSDGWRGEPTKRNQRLPTTDSAYAAYEGRVTDAWRHQ